MVIKALTGQTFRNQASFHIAPKPSINVITGRNGRGKTSVVEAIYFFSHLSSFRTRSTKDMVQKGTKQAILQAKFDQSTSMHADQMHALQPVEKIRIEISAAGRKVWNNETLVHKRSEYLPPYCAVVFDPAGMQRFRNEPAERRAFLDRYMRFINAEYASLVKKFHEVQRQKNAVLRAQQPAQLPEWNDLFAQLGCAIVQQRNAFVQRLNAVLHLKAMQHKCQQVIKKDSFFLQLQYIPSFGSTVDEAQEVLKQAVSRELQAAHCLYGPHRDVIDLCLLPDKVMQDIAEQNIVAEHDKTSTSGAGQTEAKQAGTEQIGIAQTENRTAADSSEQRNSSLFSRGEYRLGWVTLQLAIARLMQEDEQPVVLILDDLLSELDQVAQQAIWEDLHSLPHQIFITCTDRPPSLKDPVHWIEIGEEGIYEHPAASAI